MGRKGSLIKNDPRWAELNKGRVFGMLWQMILKDFYGSSMIDPSEFKPTTCL